MVSKHNSIENINYFRELILDSRNKKEYSREMCQNNTTSLEASGFTPKIVCAKRLTENPPP